MPTYQTTPYISWTFPDQAIAMNIKGVKPLQPVDLPNQNMVFGGQKYGWAEDARRMALARLETNRTKDLGMRGLINTTERSQAHSRPAHLSQTRINGKFMDPSYQYTQTPSGLRGGTGLITKEGRAWAKRKLQQRVQELNAIDSQDYSRGPPNRITILPQTVESDQLIAKIYNIVSAAATFNTSLPDYANRLVVAILRAAPYMDGAKLSQYETDVHHIIRLANQNMVGMDEAGFNEEDQYILAATKKELQRAEKIIKKIAVIQKQSLPDRVKIENFQRLADEVLREQTPAPISRNPFVDEEDMWEEQGQTNAANRPYTNVDELD